MLPGILLLLSPPSSSAVHFSQLSVDCDFSDGALGETNNETAAAGHDSADMACLVGWSEHPNMPSQPGSGSNGFALVHGSSWSVGYTKYRHDRAVTKIKDSL